MRCTGVADVIRGVEFARSEGLPLAVRGGGHSIPGFSTSDGGVVLDLSAMKAIRVDPDRRRIVAQAGCLWQDVDAEAQAFGLAVTGGLVSTTGIAGFTLGGGIGWLVRRCGLTCDNLVGADIVTADGRVPARQRGRAPGTALGPARRRRQLRRGHVVRVPRCTTSVPRSSPGWSSTRARRRPGCSRGFREAANGAPDELSHGDQPDHRAARCRSCPRRSTESPSSPFSACGRAAAEDGDAATRPFRELAPVVADLFGPMPYVAMQTLLDPLYPRGMWNYFRSAFFADLDGATVDGLLSAYAKAPNALSELHVHHLGGAMGRVPADATAFGTRDREFILNVVARTPGADGFDGVVEWARSATRRARPRRGGVRELHRRGERGTGAGVLPAGHLCPARRGEGPLRPRPTSSGSTRTSHPRPPRIGNSPDDSPPDGRRGRVQPDGRWARASR